MSSNENCFARARLLCGIYCTVNDVETIDCKNVKGPRRTRKEAGCHQRKTYVGRQQTLILQYGGLRGNCLNSSHTLKHCGVISLGALSGLHLQKYDQDDTQPGDRIG